MIKKILGIIVILAVIGGGIGWYEWHKSFTKAEDVKGISIAADKLSKEYGANEKAADSLYLNKVIEVSGAISEIDTNQDGHLMIILQTGDPMAGVQCTMRDKGTVAAKGSNITIKGYCSGNGITGVSLTQCAIKQ
jgi:hypothetical protein